MIHNKKNGDPTPERKTIFEVNIYRNTKRAARDIISDSPLLMRTPIGGDLAEGLQSVGQNSDAFGGAAANELDVVSVNGHLLGVDQEDGLAAANVAEQTCGGVDVERGADDGEEVAVRDDANRLLDHWDRLAEPDDERA